MKKILLVFFAALASLSDCFAADKASLSDFMPVYAAKEKGADIPALLKLTDLSLVNKRMTPEQMTDFLGNTLSQAKTVYAMYNSKDGLMTPLEFTHYLSDTLFDSAAGAFVSKKQKSQLRHIMKVMDLTNSRKLMTAAEISALLDGFKLEDISVGCISSVLAGMPSK